jgi:hypothetical protein
VSGHSLARIGDNNPLAELSPKHRLAIELYTNPMYRKTFGNKTASALAAGFDQHSRPGQVFNGEGMQKALAFVDMLKAESANDVAEYLERHAMDAAVSLVQQLGLDQDLTPREIPEGAFEKEPSPIMAEGKNGEYVAGYDDGHLQLARTIIQHNKSVATLAKEKREAIKLVLAYAMGPPDQYHKGKDGAKQGIDLTDLSDDELRTLLNEVREVRAQKRGDPLPEAGAPPVVEVVEAEFEVESEAE